VSPRRIAILGGAGSGKSTLARRVGEALDLPVIHLDRLVFGPGWVRRSSTTIGAGVASIAAQDAWVMDGTYIEAAELALPRADLTVWIDQPTWLRLWRCWRKVQAHRGRPRADRPDGCEEVFGWTYAWQALTFGRWTKVVERQIAARAGGAVLRLRGDAAVAEFIRGLEAD
jgi:adenylate kinase family enzyme